MDKMVKRLRDSLDQNNKVNPDTICDEIPELGPAIQPNGEFEKLIKRGFEEMESDTKGEQSASSPVKESWFKSEKPLKKVKEGPVKLDIGLIEETYQFNTHIDNLIMDTSKSTGAETFKFQNQEEQKTSEDKDLENKRCGDLPDLLIG